MFRQAKESSRFRSRPIESLESRVLMSATIGAIHPLRIMRPSADTSDSIDGITPSQIRHTYGFDQISFADGTVPADGAGQTIAIVDAFDDPAILDDLNVFDSQFGIPAPPSIKVVNQTGTSLLPTPDADWASETSMDVEWAHAIAPGASILLVETNSDSFNDLVAGVILRLRHAAGVSVVSLSWGGSEIVTNKDIENTSQLHFDSQFTTPAGHTGVTFVAASGDTGARAGVNWPSSAPNVLSVGGTTLNFADTSGTYGSETGWSGSSGGFSHLEFEPAYQLNAQLTGKRSAPDVAYDADPFTGFAVYDSVEDQGFVGWQVIGGTSAGVLQWAALFAIANQGRTFQGLPTLDGASQTLPMLYSLYNAPATTAYTNYTADFNDILNNGPSQRRAFGQASIGYDTVTGLGSPHVPDIMPILTAQVAIPLSQSPSPVSGAFIANPPASVVAGSTGSLKLKLIDSAPVRFSGSVNITLFASPDGSLTGATPLTGAAIPLLNITHSASRQVIFKFTYPVALVGTSQILFASITTPGTNTAPATTQPSPVAIAVPTVDLAVTFKNDQPAPIKPGHAVSEVLVIQNLGNVLAKGVFNLSIYAGASDISIDPVVASILNRKISIQPGKSITVPFHFNPTPDMIPGSFDITAALTSITQPADQNPTNDFAVLTTITA